jgi:hypothetical protein
MPNLGAGVEQHVNPAVTPTWVFTPTPNAPATIRIYNEGRYPVYLGASGMSQPDALAIPPGSKPFTLQNVTQTIYAISGVLPGAQAATAAASALTAGTTAITLTAVVPASLAAGTTIIVGNTAGSGWEAQVVNSTTASSQITFANPLVDDHFTSSPIYLATMQPGQVRVQAGVV